MESLPKPTEQLMGGLNGLDIAVVVIIFILIIMAGVYASDHAHRCNDTAASLHASPRMSTKSSFLSSDSNFGSNFILADRNMAFWFVGTSLFASNIGFAVLSFLWIPILSNGNGLYRQVVEFQGYLAPPIGIVLLLGVLSKRINAQGAIAGPMIGGVLGLTRLIVVVGLDTLPSGVWEPFFTMNFQHFALLLWLTTGLMCVGVSALTPPPGTDMTRLTIDFQTMFKLTVEELAYPTWVNHAIGALAVVVLAVTFSIWGIFR